MSDKTVTIPEKEYISLIEDSKFLQALQMMGVDNWSGYDEAIRSMEEDEE